MSAQRTLTLDRFGVRTTQCARTLIRIYRRFLGELAKHKKNRPALYSPAEIKEGMRRIEDAISLLGVDFDPSVLTPQHTWPKIGPLGRSEIRAGILVALRKRNDWMTFAEIADAILISHKVQLLRDPYEHFLQKVREATNVLAARSYVQREHAPWRPPLRRYSDSGS